MIGYIDALFGLHSDYKSHTSSVISLGAGPAVCDSSKRKANTNCSYKAELMGATDRNNSLFYTRNLQIEQEYNVGPANLYQYKSALASLINGNRQINIRYFFLKNKVGNGDLELE